MKFQDRPVKRFGFQLFPFGIHVQLILPGIRVKTRLAQLRRHCALPVDMQVWARPAWRTSARISIKCAIANRASGVRAHTASQYIVHNVSQCFAAIRYLFDFVIILSPEQKRAIIFRATSIAMNRMKPCSAKSIRIISSLA